MGIEAEHVTEHNNNNNKDRLRTESSYVFAFFSMIPGGYNVHPMNAGGGGVFFLIAKQRCERWSRRLRTSGYHSPHTPVPHSPVLLRSPGRHLFWQVWSSLAAAAAATGAPKNLRL